ncbi:hypothetical protein ZWY2020_045486 [Hordeum vulgare]|nr:hypothetical protein ZWY2020_045486 [Hordeum vulgare]
MAESFGSKENGQDVEKVASNYFNDLVNRSLIQPVEFDKHGSVTKCKVHDMMLDLILLKCAQENFLTILDGPQALTGQAYKIRRLSIRLMVKEMVGQYYQGTLICHSLEDLLVYLPGCIDGLMPLLTSPTPTLYRLERLVLLPDGWVTRVPSWMGQLRHLCELECEVGELQTDGVGVLADLPVLGVLELQT